MIGLSWVIALALVADDVPPPEVRTIAGGDFRFFDFSPDGKRIAALRPDLKDPAERNSAWHVDVWNIADIDAAPPTAGRVGVRSLPPAVSVRLQDFEHATQLCYLSTGELIALGKEASKNGFEIGTGKNVRLLSSTDGQKAKAAGQRAMPRALPVILFFDPGDLSEKKRWTHLSMDHLHSDKLVAFPAARTLIHFTTAGVRFLDQETGIEFGRLKSDPHVARPITLSPGEAQVVGNAGSSCLIVAHSEDWHYAIWRMTPDRTITKLSATASDGECAISPTGRMIAFGMPLTPSDQRLQIWNTETRKVRQSLLSGNSLLVQSCDFSPDGSRLVSITRAFPADGQNNSMELWHALTGRMIVSRTMPAGIGRVRFSPDGTRLLTMDMFYHRHEAEPENGGMPARLRLWDIEQMLKQP